ncbi:hypothetical protein [Actinomadura rugatobispora]|uniref:Uncharacterized protein n=1 Tax=Actinomadura rugatobispora TaxID=1994 RepID=A0ABW1A1E4_9ACTN|nr:hypothetical protein GCM10010200_029770 [Actinomadura rugatobispora]
MTDILSALTQPAGGPSHILTLGNGWSTAIDQLHDGAYSVEHQGVIDELLRAIEAGEETSIVLRTFTAETSQTLANGTRIPVKEVRGWYIADGRLHPLSEQQMFAASCTDTITGEPIAPEPSVRCTDAHPIEVGV